MEQNAYKVIDADRGIVRQIFAEEDAEKVLKYWQEIGEYGSVSIDVDGDIICFKEDDED